MYRNKTGVNGLFLTAYLTTRGTIMSMIQILAKRPELQKSLQREVDNVIGSDREPSLADRRRCHLTEAFIIESLRYISHVPLAILHAASQDTTINGYTIDKNTIVSLKKNLHERFSFVQEVQETNINFNLLLSKIFNV